MILAQNHQPLLNGNSSLVVITLFMMFLSACAVKKSSMHTIPKTDKTEPNNRNKNNSHLPAKVDTIVWKKSFPEDKVIVKSDPDQSTNPSDQVVVNKKNKTKNKFVKEDTAYRVLALMPFKTLDNDSTASKINTGSLRFVQFYAGIKMALEELDNEPGKKIILDVYDTQSGDDTKNILAKYETTPPHLIIGPQKSESVKFTAEWAKAHETSLISPWVSSSTITERNPYYIQAKAGLAAHYKLLNEHARKNYPVKNIYLISKSTEESKSRFFNDSTLYSESISEKVIPEDELGTSQELLLTPLLKEEGSTVFILPLTSSKDENYIYQFLRRVSIEKGTKDVVVYGTYKWLELKSDIIDYLNIQKIRLSISNYIDNDQSDVRNFKKKYFEKYREYPTEEALEGYDVVKFSIRALRNYGPDFQWKDMNTTANYLETSYRLIPIYKSKKISEDPMDADYFENSFIKIVELRSNKFKIID